MTNQVDTVLDALADPTRRAIVEMLAAGPQRAGSVAAAFDTAAPTISRHLRVLRTAGLIADEPTDDARVRLYRLQPEQFGHLGAWVDQVQAHWRDQLASFKEHAERVAAPDVESAR